MLKISLIVRRIARAAQLGNEAGRQQLPHDGHVQYQAGAGILRHRSQGGPQPARVRLEVVCRQRHQPVDVRYRASGRHPAGVLKDSLQRVHVTALPVAGFGNRAERAAALDVLREGRGAYAKRPGDLLLRQFFLHLCHAFTEKLTLGTKCH